MIYRRYERHPSANVGGSTTGAKYGFAVHRWATRLRDKVDVPAGANATIPEAVTLSVADWLDRVAVRFGGDVYVPLCLPHIACAGRVHQHTHTTTVSSGCGGDYGCGAVCLLYSFCCGSARAWGAVATVCACCPFLGALRTWFDLPVPSACLFVCLPACLFLASHVLRCAAFCIGLTRWVLEQHRAQSDTGHAVRGDPLFGQDVVGEWWESAVGGTALPDTRRGVASNRSRRSTSTPTSASDSPPLASSSASHANATTTSDPAADTGAGAGAQAGTSARRWTYPTVPGAVVRADVHTRREEDLRALGQRESIVTPNQRAVWQRLHPVLKRGMLAAREAAAMTSDARPEDNVERVFRVNVYFREYRDVPLCDLELGFPALSMRMKDFDRLKLATLGLSCLGLGFQLCVVLAGKAAFLTVALGSWLHGCTIATCCWVGGCVHGDGGWWMVALATVLLSVCTHLVVLYRVVLCWLGDDVPCQRSNGHPVHSCHGCCEFTVCTAHAGVVSMVCVQSLRGTPCDEPIRRPLAKRSPGVLGICGACRGVSISRVCST